MPAAPPSALITEMSLGANKSAVTTKKKVAAPALLSAQDSAIPPGAAVGGVCTRTCTHTGVLSGAEEEAVAIRILQARV